MYRLILPLSVAAFAMPAALAAPMSAAMPAPALASTIQAAPRGDGGVAIAAAPPLTLAAALALALRANPALAAARHEIDARDGAAQQAALRPNPQLQVLVEDARGDARSVTVQLNQSLELGGKRAARMLAAGRDLDVGAAELRAQEADTRAAVVQAFVDVLAAQEGLRLAGEADALAREASRIAARRVRAGQVSPVESSRAGVAEAAVRLDGQLAVSALAGARLRLGTLCGDPQARFGLADGSLEALPALPADAELARRLAGAPALRKARAELERRRALAQVESRRRTPDLTVSVGLKRAPEDGRAQAIVGLSMPLPWSDANQGNLLEALRRVDKAGDELAGAELRAGAEVAAARARLRDALLEAATLKDEIVPGARGAYDAAAKGFEFGKFAFLDVLDAQRTLLQARSRYLRALSDAHQAAAEIDRVLGAPDQATDQKTEQKTTP